MVAMSPLECFVAGVAVAAIGLGVLGFFLWRGVVRHRELHPDGAPGPFETPGSAVDARALHRRLQAIEDRLSEIQDQLRGEVKA